jgi:hypothetical protein
VVKLAQQTLEAVEAELVNQPANGGAGGSGIVIIRYKFQ